MNHIEQLKAWGACQGGLDFAAQYPTLQAAWDACTTLGDLRWVANAPIRAEYAAKHAPIRAEYEAKHAPIWDEYADCDAFRAVVKCPVEIEGAP